MAFERLDRVDVQVLPVSPVLRRHALAGDERRAVDGVRVESPSTDEELLNPVSCRVLYPAVEVDPHAPLHVAAHLLVGIARERPFHVLLHHRPELPADDIDRRDRRVDRDDVPEIVFCDRAGRHRGAVAPPVREGHLCARDVDERLQEEVVHRGLEDGVPVKTRPGLPDNPGEVLPVRFHDHLDHLLDLRVRPDLLADDDQFVVEPLHPPVLDREIEPPEEGTVAARLDDDGLVHDHRLEEAVVGVPREEDVDPVRLAGESHLLRKPEVRYHHDEIHPLLFAEMGDVTGEFGVPEREVDPLRERFRHHLVDDRGGDADDAHHEVVGLADGMRGKDQVAGHVVVAVVGEDGVVEPPRHALELLRAVSELPVGGHGIEGEGVQNGDERLALRLDDGVGPVDGVAAVEREHPARPLVAGFFEERGDPGVPARRPVHRRSPGIEEFLVRLQVPVRVVHLQEREVGHGCREGRMWRKRLRLRRDQILFTFRGSQF